MTLSRAVQDTFKDVHMRDVGVQFVLVDNPNPVYVIHALYSQIDSEYGLALWIDAYIKDMADSRFRAPVRDSPFVLCLDSVRDLFMVSELHTARYSEHP